MFSNCFTKITFPFLLAAFCIFISSVKAQNLNNTCDYTDYIGYGFGIAAEKVNNDNYRDLIICQEEGDGVCRYNEAPTYPAEFYDSGGFSISCNGGMIACS